MTSNKDFSYLSLLFINFFFNEITSHKLFSVHHTMNKGEGGEIQRSQVNPRPSQKKKRKKTEENKTNLVIPRINLHQKQTCWFGLLLFCPMKKHVMIPSLPSFTQRD